GLRQLHFAKLLTNLSGLIARFYTQAQHIVKIICMKGCYHYFLIFISQSPNIGNLIAIARSKHLGLPSLFKASPPSYAVKLLHARSFLSMYFLSIA
ncbi:MAG: hypothetical protein RR075_00085, partial [Pygmaiobacter sp.]